MSREAGKGSKSRPFSVTQDEFASNWDRIFGNRNEKADTTDQTNESFESGDLDVPGLPQGTDR